MLVNAAADDIDSVGIAIVFKAVDLSPPDIVSCIGITAKPNVMVAVPEGPGIVTIGFVSPAGGHHSISVRVTNSGAPSESVMALKLTSCAATAIMRKRQRERNEHMMVQKS